jgi:hypothetical protein
MGLSGHAGLGCEEDHVCDTINEVGEVLESLVDDSEDVADAREELHAVVEADDAVVTRIGHDVAGVLVRSFWKRRNILDRNLCTLRSSLTITSMRVDETAQLKHHGQQSSRAAQHWLPVSPTLPAFQQQQS